jgi:hypothetical protein
LLNLPPITGPDKPYFWSALMKVGLTSMKWSH